MKKFFTIFITMSFIMLSSCSTNRNLKTNEYFLYPNEYTVEYFANGIYGQAIINYDGSNTLYIDFINKLSPLYSMHKIVTKSYTKTIYENITFEENKSEGTIFWYVLDVFQELSQKTFIENTSSLTQNSNTQFIDFIFKYKYGNIYVSVDKLNGKPTSLEIKTDDMNIKLYFLNIKD